jgi:hypothetical protein
VEPGETIEFEGVGEDYIRWTGGRLGPGFVKIGLSLRNVGLAAKPGGWCCSFFSDLNLVLASCMSIGSAACMSS